MFSTPTKIAFGYILLIALLFGAIGYIYRQMILLTAPSGTEETISSRRRTTHQIVTHLYNAEIIGQTLRTGELNEYPKYKRAMREAGILIDSLQQQLTDTLQQARLDTVRLLLKQKEQNMLRVLEVIKENPTDELYRQQLDSLILQQDSILNTAHVRRHVVTHHNSYTIHHKPKKFFRRLADLFAPGKPDSTQVDNIIQEEYTDTIDETYNPADTIASMLTSIQHKVFQNRQERQRTLDIRINQLRIAGSLLSQRVNQLLESIETDEQAAMGRRIQHEQEIREQAAWTMAVIAIIAVLLVLVFFIIIWRDLTRSNHYRHELEKSKQYAENLLVAREKLMLTITHDIKAPAGSIIGYIDLLLRLVHDQRQLFYLRNMQSSARHLLGLVTSLLDYHRLEAGKMDLHPVMFNPYELFEHIYTSFLPIAGKKHLELIYKTELPRNLTVEGDPFRIRQIAENLLSNALKFTKKGNVTLHAAYKENLFSFQVSDTGCGMSTQEQARVFQAFTRLRSAQGQEGFGLGLSITKKLVELLHGNIRIESTPGTGSTFYVSMPLPLSKATPDATPELSFIPDKQWHILLIDDDPIQLTLTKTMLDNLFAAMPNHRMPVIRTCSHPEELFHSIRSDAIDLILTDIQMPAMNGFDLLKAIRKLDSPQARTVPVIAITARSDMDEADFRQQGFAGCLYKPFNQHEIRKMLQQTLHLAWDATGTPKESQSLSGTSPFNFSSLTAFSEDDPEAARQIIRTFLEETRKNHARIAQAVKTKSLQEAGETAHKMLPTFTLIEAKEILPSLQWLEAHRSATEWAEEAQSHAETVLRCMEKVMEEAEKNLMNVCN